MKDVERLPPGGYFDLTVKYFGESRKEEEKREGELTCIEFSLTAATRSTMEPPITTYQSKKERKEEDELLRR